LSARRSLSGKLDPSRQGFSVDALKEQHGAEIAQIDELEEAIAAAESAVEAASSEAFFTKTTTSTEMRNQPEGFLWSRSRLVRCRRRAQDEH
jgi:hypothetical protein